MSERPLVSVITPTWQRADNELVGAIMNVRAQTYRPLEHLIISDGLDPRADELVDHLLCDASLEPVASREVPLRLLELGRNWSSFLTDSFCAAPTVAGMLWARGTYQTWLADDERMDADHIETLVAALEATSALFAYGRVTMWRSSDPGRRWEIGSDPPSEGQITNCLYHIDVLKLGLYPFGAGMVSDWRCVERWIAAGATWAHVPRVTMVHRADH